MRTVNLFYDEDEHDFVAGLTSASPAQFKPYTIRDVVLFAARCVTRLPVPGQAVYAEKPWPSATMRASFGLVNAPPTSGSFKLKLGVLTTEAIVWPSDTSAAGIAAFKADIVAKLCALETVGEAGVVSSDPPAAPVHDVYLTWTGPTDERALEVVENGLAPVVVPQVLVQRGAPGYQQVLQFLQASIKMTDTFELVGAAQPTVEQTRIGAAGQNEIQTIKLPLKSLGALKLTWSGAVTRLLTLPGASADQVAAALNEMVPGGDLAPSFRVTAVASVNGFAVEFIGALAASPQPMIAAAIQLTVPPTTAIARLDLRDPRFVRVLNGQRKATIQFEFVRVGGGGEESTLIRDVEIQRDLSDAGDVEQLEEQGQVIEREKLIYVDAGLGDPMVLAAPGFTFRPGTSGNTLIITHGLGTWRPKVHLTMHTVNHTAFAAALTSDPDDVDAALAAAVTGSYELARGEYGQNSTTTNITRVTLPWYLVDDPTSPRDFRLLSIDVSSPVATLQAWVFSVLWDNVLKEPGGQTLTAKLAALEAQITSLVGGLKIQPAALDLPAVVGAVLAQIKNDPVARAQFIDLVKTVVSNEDIMRVIATELRNRSEFIDSIKIALEESSLITKLVEELKKSTEFMTEIRSLIFEALQKGATLPPGIIPLSLPDFHFAFPPPQEIPGGSTEREIGKIQITKTGGGTETISTEPQVLRVSEKLPRYLPLPVALESDAPEGISGEIGLADLADGTVHLVDGGVRVRTIGGRRGRSYGDGAILARANESIFPVYQDAGEPSVFWPAEMEPDLWPLTLQESQMPEGSRFELAWLQQAQLLGGRVGRIELVVLAATIPTADRRMGVVDLVECMSAVIGVDAARGFHSCVLRVTHTDSGEREGLFSLAGLESEFGLPAFPLKLVVGFRRFDTEDTPAGQPVLGCLLLDVVKPAASIVKL